MKDLADDRGHLASLSLVGTQPIEKSLSDVNALHPALEFEIRV